MKPMNIVGTPKGAKAAALDYTKAHYRPEITNKQMALLIEAIDYLMRNRHLPAAEIDQYGELYRLLTEAGPLFLGVHT